MNRSYFRYYKPKFLIAFFIIVAASLFAGFAHWGIPLSVVSVLSIILFSIDKFLWRYPPFSYLFWTADFSGRYEGYIEFDNIDENDETTSKRLKHVKVVYQTASIIKISSFTYDENDEASSPSESIDVAVIKDESEIYRLIYTFLNSGNTGLGFPPHYGTEVIKVIVKSDCKTLSGNYYTNRLPHQTRGKFVEMERVGENLEHPF